MSGRSLEGARTEMRSIIIVLENLESGLRNDFRGIGQDLCASCLLSVISYYRNTVLRHLESMDQNIISKALSSNSN